MIIITNLLKKFGAITAVKIDNYQINKGEIVGIIGNNGAGKTTLFNLILDLLKPDQGSIEIKGNKNNSFDEWKTYTCSYLNERFLIGFLKPDEYFELIAYMYKMSKIQLDEKLLLFDDFMHGEICNSNKLIRQLSSGNKQKVGIIGALLPNAELLILDEPFNYLDPTSQIILKQIIKEINKFKETTFIISSHNLNHVSEISTRITLLEKGIILKDSTNSKIEMDIINHYFKMQI